MNSLLPRRAFFALAASVLAVSASADTFNMAGSSWFSEGTELPSVCMTFEPDGTLRFKGGYLYYNPSRWMPVKSDPELIQIRLGGSGLFPEAVVKEQVAQRPNGSLARFDAKKRLLVYRIGFGNVPLEFNGLIFEPQAACPDLPNVRSHTHPK